MHEVNKYWYVLMSKPGKANEVTLRLAQAKFEVFNPLFKQYNHKQGKYFTRQLFASYLFAKFDIKQDFKLIKYTRGINKIIGVSGDAPAHVPTEFIDFLKSRCDENNIIQIMPHAIDPDSIKKGDKVTIINGPMQGAQAVVSGDYNDNERIEILMNLIKIRLPKKDLKKQA